MVFLVAGDFWLMPRSGLFLLFIVGASFLSAAEYFQTLQVKGLLRINEVAVRAHLPFKKGERVTKALLDGFVQALFETKQFSNVQAEIKNGNLIVQVEENLVVQDIAFEGNTVIKDEILKKDLNLSERRPFTRADVRAAVNRIRAYYHAHGYQKVLVTPKIIRHKKERVDLVFEIQEGNPRYVETILFQGNKRFTDAALKNVMVLKERSWWHFFSKKGTYSLRLIEQDKESLLQYYEQNGYLDAQILSAFSEISATANTVKVTIQLNEGEQYKIDSVNLESNIPSVKCDKNLLTFLPKKGEIFQKNALPFQEKRLLSFLHRKGFFGRLDTQIKKVGKNKVKLLAVLSPEKPKAIKHLRIRGNYKTNERVIRRETPISDGDPVTTYHLQDTRARIERLDYFDNLNVQLDEADFEKNTQALTVGLTEKLTSEVRLQGSFSPERGLGIGTHYSDINFLGNGQSLDIDLDLMRRNQRFYINILEPYLFGRRIQGGGTFFLRNDWQDLAKEDGATTPNSKGSGYKKFTTGLGFSLAYYLNYDLRERLRYNIHYDRLDNSQVQSNFITGTRKDWISKVGHDLIWDWRNSVLQPSKGGLVSLETDFAGLGGTVNYLMNQINFSYYWPFDKKQAYVLQARAGYGLTIAFKKDLRTVDHFFMGGVMVRGFDYTGIGPRDGKTKEALGGKQRLSAGLEFSGPLTSPELGVRWLVFNDWGSLWDSEAANAAKKNPALGTVISNTFFLRSTVGFGARWFSPFGLIGISWGWPLLVKKDNMGRKIDDTLVFRFSFGVEMA